MTDYERPPTEYGEWTRGNMGRVGRCVTTYHRSLLDGDWLAVVSWEDHPDECPSSGVPLSDWARPTWWDRHPFWQGFCGFFWPPLLAGRPHLLERRFWRQPR